MHIGMQCLKKHNHKKIICSKLPAMGILQIHLHHQCTASYSLFHALQAHSSPHIVPGATEVGVLCNLVEDIKALEV